MNEDTKRIKELTRRRGTDEEEEAVRAVLKELSSKMENTYATSTPVFIPTDAGYTEIDALFICPAGLFVFECKHMVGTVLGKPTDRLWTKTGDPVLSFPNPILQNKRHADAASSWFGIPRNYCYSYTVFNDTCHIADTSLEIFRTGTLKESLLPLITQLHLSSADVERAITKAGKLANDEKIRQKHTAQIESAKKEKRSEKKR